MKSFKEYLLEEKFVVGHLMNPRSKPFFSGKRLYTGHFSKDDLDLFKEYVRNSHTMNEYLRGSKYPNGEHVDEKKMKELIAQMDDLFKRKAITSKRPMTVFRGIPNTSDNLPDISSGPTKQFLSTTLDKNVAYSYGTAKKDKKSKNSKILKIFVPPGIPHLPNATNIFDIENEIMFDRFRTLDVDPDPIRDVEVILNKWGGHTKPAQVHRARMG